MVLRQKDFQGRGWKPWKDTALSWHATKSSSDLSNSDSNHAQVPKFFPFSYTDGVGEIDIKEDTWSSQRESVLEVTNLKELWFGCASPLQTHVFEHLVPSCGGKLWNF